MLLCLEARVVRLWSWGSAFFVLVIGDAGLHVCRKGHVVLSWQGVCKVPRPPRTIQDNVTVRFALLRAEFEFLSIYQAAFSAEL